MSAREVADALRANDPEVLSANMPLRFEDQVALDDGLRHFISVKFPLHDDGGRPYAVCSVVTDITERDRAQKALERAYQEIKQSEEDLRRITDLIPHTITVLSPDGRVIYANRGALEYTGLSLEEVRAGDFRSRVFHPDDVQRLREERDKALAGAAPFENEQRALGKDGKYRWFLIRYNPLLDETGKVIHWYAAGTDIDERKRVEAEREELLVREQAAREAAEAANRSKDEFLTVISHELRTPLHPILGYARLLRHGPTDARKVEQAAEIIERNGKAQSLLIDELLDTASIISGELRLDVKPVDLVSVIEETVQTICPAAAAKGISLQTDFASEVGQITGDRFRLQEVVWNLLSNAVKFTPEGGRVEVRLERIDPCVCITVSDTGNGISPDFLPCIFDRFRQADMSSVRKYGGLGLGLALVKYLVELHGGTIEASSLGEGQGATFKVLLPVRAVSAPLGEAKGAPVPVSGFEETTLLAGVRALVVDDEADARELVKATLAQYGASVVAATSAAEAYKLITEAPAQEPPDVIVADLGMPDEDGFSLLRRVREWEHERGLHTPAVALTAYGRVEDRVNVLMAGFQTHIAKPAEPAELVTVIASLVKYP